MSFGLANFHISLEIDRQSVVHMCAGRENATGKPHNTQQCHEHDMHFIIPCKMTQTGLS